MSANFNYEMVMEILKDVSDNNTKTSCKAMEVGQSCSEKTIRLCGEVIRGSNERLRNGDLLPEERERERMLLEGALHTGAAVCIGTQRTAERGRKDSSRAMVCLLCALVLLIVLAVGVCFFKSDFPSSPGPSGLDSPEEMCYTERYDITAEDAPQNPS